MGHFGISRAYREDVGPLHRLQFNLCGVGDPGHYLRSRYFRQFVRGLKPGRILDAGCGHGDYSFFMAALWPESRITAMDVKQSNVETTARIRDRMGLTNIETMQRDLVHFRQAASFDLILCIDVLEHIPDQFQALANFCFSLQPGGYCFLHMPLERYRPVPFDQKLQDFHEWTEEEHVGRMHSRDSLIRLVQETGFRVVREKPTFHFSRGELALSLMALFYDDSVPSRIAQTALLPVTRCLCLLDPLGDSPKSYALALLLQKPA
jgi:SAM-dependent methyltransferase